jgi:hypothetical protein
MTVKALSALLFQRICGGFCGVPSRYFPIKPPDRSTPTPAAPPRDAPRPPPVLRHGARGGGEYSRSNRARGCGRIAQAPRSKHALVQEPPTTHCCAAKELRKAIVVAQRQTAKFLELLAAIDLARLWITQGKRAEARPARTDLRLVHRRPRHADPETGEGAAGGVGVAARQRISRGCFGKEFRPAPARQL